ncbi:MAG: putative lipid II flippase FtsW [Deltaproteobacteria bacterium]|nr:putative lipid II flippase FtsW [Deltaproteobacteria bacterium]
MTTQCQTIEFKGYKSFFNDPLLLFVTILILTFGIVMVTSASFMIASAKFGDGFYYTKKQGLATIAGLSLMFLFSRINPFFWRDAAPVGLGISLLLLILVFVPGIGVELGGSRRWVRLPVGFYIQPSEIIKYAMIIFFARSLAKKGDGVKSFAIGFLPHVLIMALVVMLALAQPDFGLALIITTVGFLMMFIAGVRLQHLIGSAILCLPFLFQIGMSAHYRFARVKSFLNPWADPLSSGFQIIQSLVAFGCGGFWGVGLGKGIQKLFYLPQPHSDFILAVVGEELGLAGVIAIIILFYLLIFRGLTIAIRTHDIFLRCLAFGITSLLGIQALFNMAVTMGLTPTKGLPLPLISLGGTSLIANLAGIGILMAINATAKANQEGGGT